jgi:hypothetical protein
MEKYSRARQATDDNMAHAHCYKATNTHSQYVKLTAFPLQQWLHEFASVLHYTYIVSLIFMHHVLSSLRPAILAKPICPVIPTFSVLPHSTHLPLNGTFLIILRDQTIATVFLTNILTNFEF